jgi:hypothetical protein
VIYLGLEEKRDEVRRHFRALAIPEESSPLDVFVDRVPRGAMEQLTEAVNQRRPALVVVDGLFRLVRVQDTNAYAEMYDRLEPLLALSRRSGANVMLTHHEGKGADFRDGQDGVLGSTAIAGSVDVTFALRKDRRTSRRTIQSTARYGEDLAERVLLLDHTGRVTLGDSREEQDVADGEKAILEALEGTDPLPEKGTDGIEGRVHLRTGTLRTALRQLLADGRLVRTGAGHRGDPYLYSLPFPVSGSPLVTGTRTP